MVRSGSSPVFKNPSLELIVMLRMNKKKPVNSDQELINQQDTEA